ncbi:hypothetical protein HMPREF1247_1498 [Atopobium sp. BV3Ac4]|nr:hypothetical protein HMPREF1247_1498 [Atopobium sp. BV3Ac4]
MYRIAFKGSKRVRQQTKPLHYRVEQANNNAQAPSFRSKR